MTDIAPQQYVDPNFQVLDLTARTNGSRYEVRIGLPPGYGSGDRAYPLLVMLDADAAFGTVYETMMLNAIWSQMPLAREVRPVPEFIVVGIALPDRNDHHKTREFAQTENPFRRNFEYMPGSVDELFELPGQYMERVVELAGMPAKFGGASIFQTVLADEILPLVARNYRVSNDRRLLLGCSAGGVFCCFNLLTRPDLFTDYVIVSPGIGARTIFDMEAAWAASHDDLKAGVLLSAGGEEYADALAIASSTVRLAEHLSARRYPGLRLHHMIFPDTNHVDAVGPSLAQALKRLF